MSSEHDERPVILVVDDEPDQLHSGLSLRLSDMAQVTVRHPSDIEPEDLAVADLVLMDYRLDYWPKRDKQTVAFYVRTGMALAAILREAADEKPSARPTAVALHTAHLDDISDRIRRPYSWHVVARLNNLEWVFEKSDADSYMQASQLARAVQRLRGEWPDDANASEAHARELLGMNSGVEWFDRSWREVRECQPPIHELAGSARGILFLRWFLHQILPYPCFLWDIHWVAARLRIQVEDLRRLITTPCGLARDLRQRKYTGFLAGFLGDRWWKSAVEDYAWELGGAASGNREVFREKLREKTEEDVELIGVQHSVVCLDRDFRPVEIASPQDAVRLRSDYWPSFADAAWMKITTVEDDPMLRAMVDPLDQYRLMPDE